MKIIVKLLFIFSDKLQNYIYFYLFFRGRETKSILVKKDVREKIPRPVKEGEKLLQEHSR